MRISRNRARIIKALDIIGMVLFVIALAIALSGCETVSVRPLASMEHTSHITQHVGSNKTNYGWNTVSVGARIRARGLTLDVLDGYSIEPVDGRHEVFNARVTWEVGK
jgi:uncharacterized protein YceK